VTKFLTIYRLPIHRDDGTFGVICDGTVPFGVTLELPWRDNERNVSCIPKGTYNVDRIQVEDGIVFKVREVQGRSGIDIHIANTINDLKGCIGVGESFTEISDLTAIGSSRAGMRELENRTIGVDRFKLTILEQEWT